MTFTNESGSSINARHKATPGFFKPTMRPNHARSRGNRYLLYPNSVPSKRIFNMNHYDLGWAADVCPSSKHVLGLIENKLPASIKIEHGTSCVNLSLRVSFVGHSVNTPYVAKSCSLRNANRAASVPCHVRRNIRALAQTPPKQHYCELSEIATKNSCLTPFFEEACRKNSFPSA